MSHLTHEDQGSHNEVANPIQYTRRLDDDVVVRPDEGGRRLWQDKYRFRREMLPSFVGETFGKKVSVEIDLRVYFNETSIYKIFSTGKSLNFIRYSCHDSDWVATRDAVGNTGRGAF